MTEQANPTAEEPRRAPQPRSEQPRSEQRRPARPQAPANDNAADDGDDFNVPVEFSPDSVGRPRRIGSNIRYNDIDYKNITMLTRFIDGRGRILSRRKTRVSAKVQRRIVTAIKRARHLALLPYTADQSRIVRKRR
ncbi:MAG: 30S ribosomal protein S18 [Caldilineaceae bacterium]|nr:30S ribosomal protein S18 [Caldilineaceae bacterium]